MAWNYSVGWEQLLAGQILEAGVYPYTHIMGNMFYGIIGFLALTMIYLKTEDFGTTGVAGLLMAGASMIFLPVEIRFMASLFLTLSFTIIMYKLFKG